MKESDYKFLLRKNYQDFSRQGRYFPRTVQEQPRTPLQMATFEEGGGYEGKMDELLNRQLARLKTARGRLEARVFAFEVSREDGMSWAAQHVFEFFEKGLKGRPFKFINFSKTARNELSVPAIADVDHLFSRKELIHLASRHRLAGGAFFVAKPIYNYLLFAFSLVIGFFSAVLNKQLEELAESRLDNFAANFTDPVFYLGMAGVIVLGLVARSVSIDQLVQDKSISLQNFIRNLPGFESAPNKNYDNFIDALALRISKKGMPRIVVIDDYGSLDRTSRLAIQRYLSFHAPSLMQAKEMWIIFENPGNDNFSSWLIHGKQEMESAKHFEAFFRTFKVPVFSRREKLDIINQIDGNPAWANYRVIKHVCNAQKQDHPGAKAKLLDYVQKQGKEETSDKTLQFLSLLAVTSEPYRIPFSADYLKELLVDSRQESRQRLRSRVLNLYVKNIGLSRQEIGDYFEQIKKEFGEFLETNAAGDRLFIPQELITTINNNYKALRLPDPVLAHLFWSLRWRDQLQEKPLQSFWIKKLSYHLLHARLSKALPEDIYEQTRERYFDILINVIDWSIKTSVFEDILPLLNRAFDIYLDDGHEIPDASKAQRLLTACWDVYSVLKIEEVLPLILEINSRHPREPETEPAEEKTKTPEENGDLLESIFFDLIPYDPVRTQGREELLRLNIRDRSRTRAARDYFIAQSGWFCLTLQPFVQSFTQLRLAAGADSFLRHHHDLPFSLLEQIRTYSRYKERVLKDDNPIDYLSLSTASWCNLLGVAQFSWAIGNIQYFDELFQLNSQLIELIEVLFQKEKLVEVKDRPGSSVAQSDYFLQNLVIEVSVTNLAALVIYCSYFRSFFATPNIDGNYLNRINTHISQLNRLIDFGLPELTSFAELGDEKMVQQIDLLFGFCGVLWRKFNLESLFGLLAVRRVQFREIIAGTFKYNLFRQSREGLLEYLEPFLRSPNIAGLLANFSEARFYKFHSYAPTDRFFYQGAELVAANNFSAALKKEISLLLITYHNRFGKDLSEFVRNVLPGNYLAETLRLVPEEEWMGIVLRWNNAHAYIEDATLKDQFRQQLLELSGLAENEKISRHIGYLFEFHNIEARFNNREAIDLDDLLRTWSDRKDSFLYASLLLLCLDTGRHDSRIEEECLEVIANPAEPNFNSYILLALSFSQHFFPGRNVTGKEMVVVDFIEQNISRWENTLAPKTNYEMYALLEAFRGLPEYADAKRYWHNLYLEEEALRQLPTLIERGSFFYLFKRQFEMMAPIGLDVNLDAPWNEYQSLLSLTLEQKKTEAQNWKNSGGEIPAPIYAGQDRSLISNAFLKYGSLVFDYANLDLPEYEKDRINFNSTAKLYIPKLIDLIIQLPRFPESIRNIYLRYAAGLAGESEELP